MRENMREMNDYGTLDLNEMIEKLTKTADPIMYQYFKNLRERTIIINEAITQDIIELAVLPLIEMDNDGTNKHITIYINTVGGSVHNGFALCDVIEKLKTPTTIITLGYCYSMGFHIMLAGNKNPNVTRKCYPFSTALMHGGSDHLSGSTSQIKDYYEFTEKLEAKVKNFVLRNSNISDEQYDESIRKEWYMTSEDMLEHGIVDEII